LFDEAQSVVDRWLGRSPGDATLKTWLAVALCHQADTMTDQGHPEKARPVLERAAAVFREEAGRADKPALAREAQTEALWDLARTLRALNLLAEAARVDAERIELWTASPPDALVALALKETSRAVLIGYGRTDVSDRAKSVRKLDLDEAASNLQLAIARGFKDLGRLKAHPDAPLLLSRVDVKTAIGGQDPSKQPSQSKPVRNASEP
jgi:hypothetical protein